MHVFGKLSKKMWQLSSVAFSVASENDEKWQIVIYDLVSTVGLAGLIKIHKSHSNNVSIDTALAILQSNSHGVENLKLV